MNKPQIDFSSLVSTFEEKISKNTINKALGEPLETFSQGDILKFVKYLNSLLVPQNNTGYFSEFDSVIFSDPDFIKALQTDKAVLFDFYEAIKSNSSELDKIKTQWANIFAYIEQPTSTEHKYEDLQEDIRKSFLNGVASSPNFMRFFFLLPEVVNLLERDCLGNLSRLLSIPGFNPMDSSTLQTCRIINKINSSVTNASHRGSGRILPLPNAQQLGKLGFNFDWLIAFDDASLHPNKVDNSLLGALYTYQFSYKTKTVQEYIDFTYENSRILKISNNIEKLMDMVHAKGCELSASQASYEIFSIDDKNRFLNALKMKYEVSTLSQALPISQNPSITLKI